MKLRPYQEQTITDARRAVAGLSENDRAVVIVAPTGAGKTVIASQVIRGAVEKGKRMLFAAHRRELIQQACQKLEAFGVDHGMIMAGERMDERAPVQVASVDTLRSWLTRGKIDMPRADLFFIDEAHRSLSPTYQKLVRWYLEAGATVLGLTATPIRGDQKGLGHIYRAMVEAPQIPELIKQGYLVKPIHYAPCKPDLAGVRKSAGDYNAKQLEKKMDKPKLVGDIVSHYLKLAADRPAIVFASGVKHSIHITEAFKQAGVPAVHIDGTTPIEEREAALQGMRDGTYRVISNCMVLTEGFDLPLLSCCILARPTMHMGLMLQMAGRVLRTCEGKEDALIIDHSGALYEHGLVDEERAWSLDTEKTIKEREEKKREKKEAKQVTCEECSALYEGKHVCPMCGHINAKRGGPVAFVDGELREISKGKKAPTMDEKRAFFGGLKVIQSEKGYKDGWVANTYRKKYGVWPRGVDDAPHKEHEAARGFVKYLQIRWAKSKRREELRV